jgi:hypothetical protein
MLPRPQVVKDAQTEGVAGIFLSQKMQLHESLNQMYMWKYSSYWEGGKLVVWNPSCIVAPCQ